MAPLLGVSMMFSGLMSRCRTPLLCAVASASVQSIAMERNSWR